MDKKEEKTKQKFQIALTNPGNDKVAVIYSVRVNSVRIVPACRPMKGKKEK